MDSGKLIGRNFFQKHRCLGRGMDSACRFNAGNWDNNAFRARPAQCAGSASGSGGRARRCAGRRSAPAERSRALRRHPRNLRPTIRPAGWRASRTWRSASRSRSSSAASAGGPPARPDAGLKQALVGIDVAHAGQQGLVQQRRLDGQVPVAKERGKRVAPIVSGSAPGASNATRRRCADRGTPAGQSGADRQSATRCRWPGQAARAYAEPRELRCRNQQSPRHSQMHDPLRMGVPHALARARALPLTCPAQKQYAFPCDARPESCAPQGPWPAARPES